MKKFVLVTLVALLLSFVPSAFADEFTFSACSADKKEVVLKADVDNADEAPAHVRDAFKSAAESLSAEDLEDTIGFMLFMSKLSDSDKQHLNSVIRPSVVGVCK